MSEAAIPLAGKRRGLITATVMIATFMALLDSTIANVALPHIQGDMGATYDQIIWVLTGYIVATAVATPLSGALASRFGRKRLHLAGVAGFTITSALCGIATSLPEIVIYRVLQGVSGATLVPLSQATLLEIYPKEKHGFAMAIWGMGIVLAPVLGPTLGGILTEFYDWRWIFFVNVPVGLLALWGIVAFVPDSPRRTSKDFDFFGFVLIGTAIGAFQLMLDRGETLDWFESTEIIAEATLAALMFYMFLVHSATRRDPFIPPAMFTDRNFVVGTLMIFAVSTTHLGALALLPPYLQHLMDYPVLTTGYVLAPRGFGTMIGIIAAQRLSKSVDMRYLVLVGIALNSFALWEFSLFTLDVPAAMIVTTGMTQGVGLGLILVPMTTLAFSTLESRYVNEATAMYNLVRNLGASVGISFWVTLISQNTRINHAILAESLTPFRAMPDLPLFWQWRTPLGAAVLDAEVTRQAAAIAYIDDFAAMMWVSLACAIPALLLRKSGGRASPQL